MLWGSALMRTVYGSEHIDKVSLLYVSSSGPEIDTWIWILYCNTCTCIYSPFGSLGYCLRHFRNTFHFRNTHYYLGWTDQTDLKRTNRILSVIATELGHNSSYPRHLLRLIRGFSLDLCLPIVSPAKTLIRLHRGACWSESSLGAYAIL